MTINNENLELLLSGMSYDDFVLHLLDDQLYLEAFCQKYNTQVVNIFPNTEDSPPEGLVYVFDNGYGGGYSMAAIKGSLERRFENIEQEGE